jgi:hypothetical protein
MVLLAAESRLHQDCIRIASGLGDGWRNPRFAGVTISRYYEDMTETRSPAAPDTAQQPAKPAADAATASNPPSRPREIGGPRGLEPTRYGDWERNGRVSDF